MTAYLFPINFAFNSFSLSLIVVVAGLSGHHALAADLSLAQAAMIALFFGLSANARNLILKSSDGEIENSLIKMRLLSALPLAAAAFAVSVLLSKVGVLISAAIVVRQLSEWFSELELARLERSADHGRAKVFLFALFFPLVAVMVSLLFVETFFIPALFVWALFPTIVCSSGIVGVLGRMAGISIAWRRILPNYGSTIVIGVVVFFFRLLIAGFSGKEIAGQLFTAFALGSIVGSLYDRTIGPSFKVSEGLSSAKVLLFRLAWLLPAAGAALIAVGAFLAGSNDYLSRNIFLVGATGFSLVGGFVMLGAQTIKINILHSATRDDVFMADLLSNFAILVSVPAAFLLFGETAFMALFLTNALLVYSAYWLISGHNLLAHTPSREKSLHYLTAFAVIMPLFIQLGAGIYRGQVELYDWGGRLSMLPLPLSAFLCFPLILVLHSFRGVKTFAVFAFVLFSAMMCATVVSSPHDTVAMRDKLLLAMQYLLPVFGLVLAEHAGASDEFSGRLARVFLYVVPPVAALQVCGALFLSAGGLNSYLYFFSIYNNAQYAPVVFSSAFLLALFLLWESAGTNTRRLLLLMVPLMAAYAALARSVPALVLLWTGLALFWSASRRSLKAGGALLAGLLVSALLLGAPRGFKAAVPAGETAAAASFCERAGERLAVWSFYLQGVRDGDAKTLLFGHPVVPHRKIYPSAHNYYLDVLYNFGLAALLPIFILILYTLRLFWLRRDFISGEKTLWGLVLVVLFLVLAENSFNVGFRQPYPGLFSFFLWGLLIKKLGLPGVKAVPETRSGNSRLAILNLTGGGISGGHKKYLSNILAKFSTAPELEAVLCASPASVNVQEWVPGADKISFAECEPFVPFRHKPSAALNATLDTFKPDMLFIPVERYLEYAGKPVVVMLQNMAPLSGVKTGTGLREALVSVMRRYETRYALKRAAAVIVPTAYVKDFLVANEGLPDAKVHVIHYGDSPDAAGAMRPAGLPAAWDKFIFTAGSLENYRGIEDLLRALPELKAKFPGVKLAVAGGARPGTFEYLEALKKTAASLGLSDDVAYLGNVGGAELSWCYSNCAAFALTSRMESFCFVALEAMTHGCGIVSADSACLPEILGPAALYYRAGEYPALAAALGRVLARGAEERLEVSAVTRERAASFSWDRTARETIEVLFRATGR